MLKPLETVLRVVPTAVLALLAACSSDPASPGMTAGDSDALPGQEVAASDLSDNDASSPEDATVPTTCTAGEKACILGKPAVCDGQFGWLIEACPEGLVCQDGECVKTGCPPLETRCADDAVEICAPDGMGWSKPMPCPEDTQCVEGACVSLACAPGDAVCVDNKVLACDGETGEWTATPCEDGEVCFEGQCIECIKDADCESPLSCVDGVCLPAPLEIVTASLPDGKMNEPYEATLEASGGVPPYVWSLADGSLPAGLTLEEDGVLAGTPTESGDFTLSIEVTDGEQTQAAKEYKFTIFSSPAELVITTGSPLPGGTEGEPYQVQLKASGGTSPYFWGITAGELPPGLVLTSSGLIDGLPAAHGDFTFTVKVFDAAEPVGSGSKEFLLTLKIAPLEIIGDQEFNLLITKVIVLPLITTVEAIPIPYSTDLKAKGGVKPYHWSEVPLPSFVGYLIPNGGIPKGLTLEENGNLHGAVTDPSGVVNVKIPFTQIDLSGYFFMAQVEDSQSPPESKSALYLVPTVPVSF